MTACAKAASKAYFVNKRTNAVKHLLSQGTREYRMPLTNLLKFNNKDV